MRIKSHPGVLLVDHLQNVAIQCGQMANQMQIRNKDLASIWTSVSLITGYLHDFAKITPFFQEYLKTGQTENSRLKTHALASACLADVVIDMLCENAGLSDDVKYQIAMAGFLAVKRHHGTLLDLDREMPGPEDFELIRKQFDSINPVVAQNHLDPLSKLIDMELEFTSLSNRISQSKFEYDIEDQNFELRAILRNKKQIKGLFELEQTLYAMLLFADKRDASIGEPAQFAKHSEFNKVQEFFQNLQPENGENISYINGQKNKAFNTVLQFIPSRSFESGGLFSVSLPTGLGKTLTSFAAAQKIQQQKQNRGKIIIAIPFTSIIDQNYEAYRDMIQASDTAQLLKHHHLAEREYKTGDDDIFNERQQKHLIETWESGVVVTTFVQVLDTIIPIKKAQLLKLHSFQDAVLILDEVQQIPYELWKVVKKALQNLVERYKTTIIFVTATQPLMFNPRFEIEELVPDHEAYFEIFDRTKLTIDIEKPIKRSEFIELISREIRNNKKKSILTIVNTKKDAREIFSTLRKEFSEERIIHLSTAITSYERKKLIQEIKTSSGIRKIVISTQLVEAGVDISMDMVFRILAPLDSIIQAAGRANRYNERVTKSDIYVIQIEESVSATNMIYGSILIDHTKAVLKFKTKVSESQYSKLVQSYFERIQTESEVVDCGWIGHQEHWRFEELNKFQLIPDQPNASLFVNINEEADEVWNRFLSIVNNDTLDHFDRKFAFEEIKATFYDYVVNIKKSQEIPCREIAGFYYYDFSDGRDDIYDYYQGDQCGGMGFIYEGSNPSLSF